MTPVERDLEARIHDRNWEVAEPSVDEAATVEGIGDRVLARALLDASLSIRMRTRIARALGSARGLDGPDALAHLLDQEALNASLRCAAMWALGRRSGRAATPVLGRGLALTSKDVQECAVRALAAFGDDKYWNEAKTVLLQRLARKRNYEYVAPPSDVQSFVTYLALGADASQVRVDALVVLIRSCWNMLHDLERSWLIQLWPDVGPGGPDLAQVSAPTERVFRDWFAQLPAVAG